MVTKINEEDKRLKTKSMKKLTPMKAIRKKCLDCMASSAKEVRLCPIEDCSLYLYRFGRNPRRKGIGYKKAKVPSEKRS